MNEAEKNARIGALIRAATVNVSDRRHPRTRHEVTADRLRDLLYEFSDHIDGAQKDEISRLIDLLEELPVKP